MMKSVLGLFDYRYFLKFAFLFLLLYYSFVIIIGITTPGGSYYSFAEQYLNFPVLIRIGVLNGAKFILYLLGFETFIDRDYLINKDGFKMLRMSWPCYGMMIKSFWIAYVVAQTSSLRSKLKWSFAGVFVIYLLNCFRVTFMMVAMEKNWKIAELLHTNNHDLFNYFSYILIILMILLYNKKNRGESTKTADA